MHNFGQFAQDCISALEARWKLKVDETIPSCPSSEEKWRFSTCLNSPSSPVCESSDSQFNFFGQLFSKFWYSWEDSPFRRKWRWTIWDFNFLNTRRFTHLSHFLKDFIYKYVRFSLTDLFSFCIGNYKTRDTKCPWSRCLSFDGLSMLRQSLSSNRTEPWLVIGTGTGDLL